MSETENLDTGNGYEIAIIGMAGRFPKAKDLAQFWVNLCDGLEAVSYFTDEEALASGADPKLLNDPHYVKAAATLEDIDLFDASFFGYYPREAAILDPQQRIFLETAWEALENAGYDAEAYKGYIGVFAGLSMNSYLIFNLIANQEIVEAVSGYQLTMGNDKDFMPTRVSYKLNLRGPSVNLQTACSTSLVAVHMACQSLTSYQCDMAMAGGVSIRFPQKQGYLYQEGGILSPDGHCRAFDAEAQGTVGGEGVGAVILKRLADAMAEGDTIYAVIKGSAINNDGSLKVGYTAPSVEGQAEVISMAHALAGVDPETIQYIEAHGTGTALGDPIEIAALTQVFRARTQKRNFCGIGSLKTNIGHLDAAAGVASLIKTVLALQHAQIPPSINFNKPNPKIDFENSPFYINAKLVEWKTDGGPRRAGVSSFGIGGTNVHAVLEQAPDPEPTSLSRDWQLLLMSARTDTGLELATQNLAQHLRLHPELTLADVAYTLQTGRKAFEQRRVVVCRDTTDGLAALEGPDQHRALNGLAETSGSPVAFMFTGQGAQYINMGRDLYQQEPVFREQVDLCARVLEAELNLDLRELIYPSAGSESSAADRLKQTNITQPALFVIEYALAKLWMSWGIRPEAMIGHSIGEYVAACLAGVFSLEDALRLVAARGRLMQSLPSGAMLSVPLTEIELQPYLESDLALAAVNGPGLCVVSGPVEAIDRLEQRLKRVGVDARRLFTSHAFHSPMMGPILEPFSRRVAQVILKSPQLPFISNLTGTWITVEQAIDPNYWARHLRETVRFMDGIGELLKEPTRIFLEIGPGRTLSSLAKNHTNSRGRLILPSIRHPNDVQPDQAFILSSLGQLWLSGCKVDWAGFYGEERRHRVPLPTYPFERQRYWIEPHGAPLGLKASKNELRKRPDISEWFYTPSWRRQDLNGRPESGNEPRRWLIFSDGSELTKSLLEKLTRQGRAVMVVESGKKFEQLDWAHYLINPQDKEDFVLLIKTLGQVQALPETLIYMWSLNPSDPSLSARERFDQAQASGLYGLLYLAQALGHQNVSQAVQIGVVSAHSQAVTGEEMLFPEKTTLLAAIRVIPQEYPNLTCRGIDLPLFESNPSRTEWLADRLIAELVTQPAERFIAYRGSHRWVQTFEPLEKFTSEGKPRKLREKGVYLITGGMGRIGLTLAEYLARTCQARLALVDRFAFLPPEEWTAWLNMHPAEDVTSRRIERLQNIEKMGGQVLVLNADVADQRQMQAALGAVHNLFGGLNGVIHAAGLVGEQSIKSIQQTGIIDCLEQFQSKAFGLINLEKVLEGEQLDFCLLQSSLSTILGGIGLLAYAAANTFMDAFVDTHNQANPVTPWTSVNWDGWRFGDGSGVGTTVAELSMTPEEGLQVFDRVLMDGQASQVVVSTGDLEIRLKQWIQRETHTAGELPEKSSMLHPRPRLHTSYVAPVTQLEKNIAETWQKVLGIEQVGIYDDFFEMGGHSLLATQLVSRLRDTYHVELPLPKLFETPTVAGLAALIEAARGEPGNILTPVILPVPRQGDLPLSFGQQRLWFLDQLEPDSPLYNNFAAVRMTGSLNISALQQSLLEIVRRHEALRTTFRDQGGTPVQVIAPELVVPMPVVDLSVHADGQHETELLRYAVEEARRPFNLAKGPLFRIMVIRLQSDEHVVFLTMHHIISDGWSVSVLIQELGVLYTSFTVGKGSPLSDLPVQYVDYAVWQRNWMQGPVLEDQLGYWKQQLSGDPVTLDLPADRPRPAVQTSRGAIEWFDLPESLSDSLVKLCRQEGVTTFMALLATFQTLLYRYTGLEDISVGTPIANRNRAETEKLIGFILNTLVMRTDLSNDPTFRELLRRVRKTAVEAYAHQDLPFEMLVEELRPQRDRSRSPLFQVIFDLQIEPLQALKLPDLTISPLKIDSGTAKFDLALSMEEAAGGRLSGFVNYNTDLYDRQTIQSLLKHFQNLLQEVVTGPEQRLSDLHLLDESEYQQLILDWNSTDTYEPPAMLSHRAFEAQVLRTPDDIALVSGNKQLTYAELNIQATQLANRLHKHGVGREKIVGVCMERSVEVVVAVLGIFKAGGALLPLDPTYPKERLAFMIDDAQVDVLLTQSWLLDHLPDSQMVQVCLDTDISERYDEPEDNPTQVVMAHDLAYVMYTSGSTGRPKGVLIEHGTFANHIRDVGRHFQIEANDRVLQFASLNFDPALEQIFTTLTVGAQLVLRDNEVWPAEDLDKKIARYGLTVINIPPVYWHQWAQHIAQAGSLVPKDQLKLVIIGGDVILPETIDLWRSTPLKSARLLNAYGPTETTITAATFEIPSDGGGITPFKRVPFGRPLANRKMYILDPHGHPVPRGASGELHIGGAGLARGYLNLPELTAEKFIPDPFSAYADSRLYKTGDLVHYLEGGEIEFLGRIDQQVKLRGMRIELGEIESAFAAHPEVREAAAMIREDIPGEKRLAVYLVCDQKRVSTTNELYEFVKDKLPGYMLPSAIVMMEALPLLVSGKVDRRALPMPEAGRVNLRNEYLAPRTPVEKDLAQLWSELVGVEKVGINDNFFEMGGHSLLATQLVSRVRAKYQVELPLQNLFEMPTIAGLASTIEESLVQHENEDDLAQMLDELDGLSKEEIQRFLKEVD